METTVSNLDLIAIIQKEIDKDPSSPISRAREHELRNISSFALVEGEDPEAKELVEAGRKRLIELIARPDWAGNHQCEVEECKLKDLFYNDND